MSRERKQKTREPKNAKEFNMMVKEMGYEKVFPELVAVSIMGNKAYQVGKVYDVSAIANAKRKGLIELIGNMEYKVTNKGKMFLSAARRIGGEKYIHKIYNEWKKQSE